MSREVEGFAAAKINVCLRVVGRRTDGYHLLDSLVVPIRLFDRVQLRSEAASRAAIRLTIDPPGAVPGGKENLVWRAATLFMERTARQLSIEIRLTKRIPAGAGLGGGSSDAAMVLLGLNAQADDPASSKDLAEWALELGADVPFFLFGRPARMRGIGEQLSLARSPIWAEQPIVVAHPRVALETGEVFERYDDSLTTVTAPSRVPRLFPGLGSAQAWLINDLEAAALQIMPTLKNLKRQLRALGAQAVMMTGSGSAMFGVWDRGRWDDARAAAIQLRAGGIWACVTEVLERVPAVVRDGQHGGRSPSW